MAESEEEGRRGGRREGASKARHRTTTSLGLKVCRWGEDGDPHVVPTYTATHPRRRSRVGLLMSEFSSERPRQKNQGSGGRARRNGTSRPAEGQHTLSLSRGLLPELGVW